MKVCLFSLLVFFVSLTHASVRVGSGAFAPENSFWIGVDDKAAAGITEDQFNEVLDQIFYIYKPIAAAKGITLVNERDWEDGTVNSYASQNGKTWEVASFGGLARYSGMTKDAFALIACHELGHHFGGAPKYKRVGGTWAASEGQADYYGTLKCMKRYLENEDNVAYVSDLKVPAVVEQRCSLVFANSRDSSICIRSSLAGHVLAKVLKDLSNEKDVSFDTPDTSVVKNTLYNAYPAIQCRLDTYFAGALCDKLFDEEMSNTSPLPGACNRIEGKTLGVRPLCWYKP